MFGVSSLSGVAAAKPFMVTRMDPRLLIKDPRGRGYTVNADRSMLPGGNLALHYVPVRGYTSKVLVLVHGLSHSGVHFDRLAAEMAGRYDVECVSLGLPGHYGDPRQYTEREFASLTLEDYARDIREKLSALAGEFGRPLVVLGHSMGGLGTLEALTAASGVVLPEVSGVILLSSVGSSTCGRIRRTLPMLMAVGANVGDLLTGKPILIGLEAMRRSFFNGEISAADFRWFMATCQPEANKATWQLVRAAFGPMVPLHYVPEPDINIGNRPVLNLYGEKDVLVAPATALELAEKLKGRAGEIITRAIPGAPHDSMITNPAEVARIIAGHMGSL